MNNDDQRDHLVDMLLRELVGEESPPDVTEEVLERLDAESCKAVSSRVVVAPSRPIPVALPSSRNRWLALAAVITLAAVSAGLLVFRHRMLTHQSAIVTVMKMRTAGTPERLKPGARVRTAADEEAVLRFADGTRVVLGPESRLVIVAHSSWEPDKRLRLESGVLKAEVAPQPEGYPMQISTEFAEAVVLGTRFILAQSDRATRLEVSSGRVSYRDQRSEREVEVKAGAYAESGPAVPLQSGLIPSRQVAVPAPAPEATRLAVTGFTLMNADTDLPIAGFDLLPNGAEISLSALPTPRISIRANFSGPADDVVFTAKRIDGGQTGLEPKLWQGFPPYFIAGDHSKSGRAADCRPWTPEPGSYRITATPHEKTEQARIAGKSLTLEFTVVP